MSNLNSQPNTGNDATIRWLAQLVPFSAPPDILHHPARGRISCWRDKAQIAWEVIFDSAYWEHAHYLVSTYGARYQDRNHYHLKIYGEGAMRFAADIMRIGSPTLQAKVRKVFPNGLPKHYGDRTYRRASIVEALRMYGTLTPADLSARVGIPLRRVYYHLAKLEAAGVVACNGVGGRHLPVKHYAGSGRSATAQIAAQAEPTSAEVAPTTPPKGREVLKVQVPRPQGESVGVARRSPAPQPLGSGVRYRIVVSNSEVKATPPITNRYDSAREQSAFGTHAPNAGTNKGDAPATSYGACARLAVGDAAVRRLLRSGEREVPSSPLQHRHDWRNHKVRVSLCPCAYNEVMKSW
jgi:DNA-binding transcriptional ArsR family regulator